MKILVTVASKHGATGEIGEVLAGVLRDAGLEAETLRPQDVASLDGYDAVVWGARSTPAAGWNRRARSLNGMPPCSQPGRSGSSRAGLSVIG